jgi:enoyl-CoA hydratase/carnithine racemase
VDGPAVGVGTTMLLHCDLVVATPRARFQMPFVALGLVPEGGSSLLLPQLAGLQRATEWLLLGTPIDAPTLASVGLVNRVVEPDALESTTLELAQALAARPATAVRAAKALLRAPQRDALRAALAREGASFIERLASPEAAAAMTAFFARR